MEGPDKGLSGPPKNYPDLLQRRDGRSRRRRRRGLWRCFNRHLRENAASMATGCFFVVVFVFSGAYVGVREREGGDKLNHTIQLGKSPGIKYQVGSSKS
uniref:Uncharacterized protein n=1 Tax=Oryza nivara TaxID=4536 RepID=A0A0E0FX39_ORYNI